MTSIQWQPESVIAGFVLAIILAMALLALLLSTRRSFMRRLADWLLNRRGFEKLGRPLRVRPVNTPYEKWLAAARSKLPVHDCLYVDDVRTIPLESWPEQGQDVKGLYLRLADYQITDGRIIEIPAGGATGPARHMFEMAVYFLNGLGHTVIDREGKPSERIDWTQRGIFSVPINCSYQHFNDTQEPVRLLAISSFPFVLNTTGSQAFIVDNPFEFRDRMPDGHRSTAQTDPTRKNRAFADYVNDALTAELSDHSVRGAGIRNLYWTMAGNTMLDVNVTEMPAQSIKRAHRATSDATVLMLSGEGHLVMWPEGAWHRKIRIEWRDGTLVAQPIYWYRQFMNPSDSPARNLTVSARSLVENLGLRFLDQMENDHQGIRKGWAAELKKRARAG